MTATEVQGNRSVTPSGVVVEYESQPKRLYRVNGVEVPSVTTALKVLSAPGLPWWGMKVGIQGTLDMIRTGRIGRAGLGDPVVDLDGTKATADNVTDLLKQHKLTVNHTLSRAGDRGTSVHSALEAWGETKVIPDPEFYPQEERGYVEGLRKFLLDVNLSSRPKLEQETMVGSAEHGFAGRYDLAVTLNECSFVTNVTPVRGETRTNFEKGRALLDLKTSKGTYDTHHLQLAAYELAAVECGYSKTAWQAVVRVGADGSYVVTRNRAVAGDFLSVLGTYNTIQDLKGRK